MNPFGAFLPMFLVVVMLGSNAYSYYKGYQHGEDNVRASLLVETQEQIRQAQEHLQTNYREAVKNNENTAKEYAKGLKDAHDKQTATLNNLHNGDLRLYNTTGLPAPIGIASAQSGAPHGNNGPQTTELSKPTAEFLIDLAADADSVVDQLTACQRLLNTH